MTPHLDVPTLVRAALFIALALAPRSSVEGAETVVDLASYPDCLRVQANNIGDSFFFLERCDVNGDKLADVVLSAYEGDGPGNTRPLGGEAYIIYGARKRWSGTTSIGQLQDVVIYGRSAGDNFGSNIACADTNGDGFDDLVIGAYSADSAAGQRVDSGQVHIILGAAQLPPVIDLATAPNTTIWGAGAGYTSGRVLEVGDINGDGLADVVINARNAPGKGGSPANTGRAYVLFGRAFWPATIDLATQSDVIVYGADANERISSGIAVGDLDRDGTAELVIGASAASGPTNGRPAAGDIYVFRGRTSWPTEIDLKTTAPDTLILGADNFDQFGGLRSVRIGDVDGDGSADVTLGASNADGLTNTAQSTGECRVAEFGSSFPSLIDLGTDSRFTLYGISAGDTYGYGVEAADVNGDNVDDIWIDAVNAKGPGDQRSGAGEARIVFGGPSLPAVLDLGVSPADIVVYGGAIDDGLASLHGTDLNDDGFAEITVNTSLSNLVRLTSLWLLSPFDVDGDGLTQLVDNCPLVSNPSQNDINADGRGDACATDWDGDGQADAADCAPSRSTAGTPGPVSGVHFRVLTHSTLDWNATQFADRYDVTRLTLPMASAGDYGQCINTLDPDRSDTSLSDEFVPLPGAGLGYLVRGWSRVCGLSGSWGTTSAGAPRVNSNPGACP